MYYTALTQYLGFWKFGDEYKVMGLAAYGQPEFLEEFRHIVRSRMAAMDFGWAWIISRITAPARK